MPYPNGWPAPYNGASMKLLRSMIALSLLAALAVSMLGSAPAAAVGGGVGGCCSDCGDECACPLPGLGEDSRPKAGGASAEPRFDGPVVSAECGGCPVAVGGNSSHRLDAREARVVVRGERSLRAGRTFESRPSAASAEICPEISPRAPPSSRV